MKVKCNKCNKRFDYEKTHGICNNCGIYNRDVYNLKNVNNKEEINNNLKLFLKENCIKVLLLILSLFLPILAFFFSITQIIS